MGTAGVRGCVDRDPHSGLTPENTPRVQARKRDPRKEAKERGKKDKRRSSGDAQDSAAEIATRMLSDLDTQHNYQELADAIVVGQDVGVSKEILSNARTRLAQLEKERAVKDSTSKAMSVLGGVRDLLDKSDVDALSDAIDRATKETAIAIDMCKSHLEKLREKVQEEKRTNLLEHYSLEEKLGEGSFGVVYACRSRSSNEKFAVKMVDKVESPLQIIMAEVKVLEQLNHPNIVRFVAVLYEKCFVCIVMEIYVANLVTCMLTHWKAKGKLLISDCRRLCAQMSSGIAYLHDNDIVHRDVKGDNYLTTLQELSDPAIKVVLTDFGTACKLNPGQKLSESCGTKAYWSPEFYDRAYGLKVDVWAVGVIAYAMLDGKFPFQDEKEVKNNYLKLPKNAPELFDQFIRGCLTKDETKRLSAQEMMKHEFLDDSKTKDIDGHEIDKCESGHLQEGQGLFAELALNEDVAERRDELVGRLQKWYVNFVEGDMDGTASASVNLARVNSKGMVDCGRRASVTPEAGFAFQEKFQLGKVGRKGKLFEWWTPEKFAAEESLSVEGAKLETGGADKGHPTESVSKMLAENNLDVSAFGKNEAKTLNDLANEVQKGTCRLMLDATQHKKLVRVVDVVLLRLIGIEASAKDPDRYLIEVSERYPDGRKRFAFRLPGTKKEPYESTKEATSRIVTDILHMADCEITFDFQREIFEESQESPSYPGLTTVYRKEIVEGRVKTLDSSIQERVCLVGEKSTMEVQDSKGNTKCYKWCDDESCEDKRVQLQAPQEKTEISGLVQAPIGMKVDELCKFLLSGNIDISKFGKSHTKSLKEFSQELVKGESSLMQDSSGRVLRIVDLVALKIIDDETGNILVQTGSVHSDGVVESKNQLPGHKRRPDENHFAPVKLLVVKELGIEENCVHIDAKDVKLIQEEKDSPSYPDLRTVYRKRIVTVHINRNESTKHEES